MKKMMRAGTAAMLVLFVTSLCFAQETTEKAPIKSEKKWYGRIYTYQVVQLRKLTDFYPIMENSLEAVSQVKKARTNRGVAIGCSGVGGFLLGWPLGEALAGAQNPTWVLAAVGGGLAIVGIGFGVKSDKQLKKGVDIYNESISRSDADSYDVEIAFTANGINVNVRF
jgi:hypothetical protein